LAEYLNLPFEVRRICRIGILIDLQFDANLFRALFLYLDVRQGGRVGTNQNDLEKRGDVLPFQLLHLIAQIIENLVRDFFPIDKFSHRQKYKGISAFGQKQRVAEKSRATLVWMFERLSRPLEEWNLFGAVFQCQPPQLLLCLGNFVTPSSSAVLVKLPALEFVFDKHHGIARLIELPWVRVRIGGDERFNAIHEPRRNNVIRPRRNNFADCQNESAVKIAGGSLIVFVYGAEELLSGKNCRDNAPKNS